MSKTVSKSSTAPRLVKKSKGAAIVAAYAERLAKELTPAEVRAAKLDAAKVAAAAPAPAKHQKHGTPGAEKAFAKALKQDTRKSNGLVPAKGATAPAPSARAPKSNQCSKCGRVNKRSANVSADCHSKSACARRVAELQPAPVAPPVLERAKRTKPAKDAAKIAPNGAHVIA